MVAYQPISIKNKFYSKVWSNKKWWRPSWYAKFVIFYGFIFAVGWAIQLYIEISGLNELTFYIQLCLIV